MSFARSGRISWSRIAAAVISASPRVEIVDYPTGKLPVLLDSGRFATHVCSHRARHPLNRLRAGNECIEAAGYFGRVKRAPPIRQFRATLLQRPPAEGARV